MKVSEMQTAIFEQTGLKTSVKKLTGSMKHHIKIWPIYQNGDYPKFPFEWGNEFKKQFKAVPELDAFPYFSPMQFDIPAQNFTEFDPIIYKKERRPRPIDENTKVKEWGSKNSQLRLDKAAARYAKALRRGENRARYC